MRLKFWEKVFKEPNKCSGGCGEPVWQCLNKRAECPPVAEMPRGQTVDVVVVDEPKRVFLKSVLIRPHAERNGTGLRYWDVRASNRKKKPQHEMSCDSCGSSMSWVIDQFVCPYRDCPLNMGRHSIYAGIKRGRYCKL